MPDVQKWYFTFGFGQLHQGCFHVILADDSDAARALMNARYGRKWGFQYTEEEWFYNGISQAERYGLKEIR